MFVMSLSLSLILIRFSFLSYDWLFQWPDKLKKKNGIITIIVKPITFPFQIKRDRLLKKKSEKQNKKSVHAAVYSHRHIYLNIPFDSRTNAVPF